MKEIINTQTIKRAIDWFHSQKRTMPWRENPSPYRVWISEVMLQQTTVATVHQYFLRFMNRFPTLSDLAKADEQEVLHLWAGLGYYSRARNLLKTAKIIQIEENFPSTFQELLTLPGIGEYTAGAISSIAFGNPDSLVDTNVDRVLGRFLGLLRSKKDFNKIIKISAQKIMNIVAENFTAEIPFWNQILMEIGALLCSTKNTQCDDCPLQPECIASKNPKPIDFPGDKVKAIISNKEETIYIIKINTSVVVKKNNSARRKGLYDFVDDYSCSGKELGVIKYRISNDRIERKIVLIETKKYIPKNKEEIINIQDLYQNYPLTSPCKKIIEKYLK